MSFFLSPTCRFRPKYTRLFGRFHRRLPTVGTQNRTKYLASYHPLNADRALVLKTAIDAFPEFRLLREIYRRLEEIYEAETYEDAENAWDA